VTGAGGVLHRGRFLGPYRDEVEFKGKPWPPLVVVNRALKKSYRYLNALGLS
jgi:hypothetical protein